MKLQKFCRAAFCAILLLTLVVSGAFAESWEIDTRWYDNYKNERGTKENPFLISTPEELAGLAQLTNKVGNWQNPSVSFKGKYILLTRDINLENKEWTPIGWKVNYEEVQSGFNKVPNYKGFDGIFDGGGHTVEGLSIVTCENLYVHTSGQSEAAGLFGYIDNDGTVKNLTVEGSVNASLCEAIGGMAGWADGVIENCVTNVEVKASSSKRGYAGGIAGLNSNKKQSNTNDPTPVNAMIRNCVAFGNIESRPLSYSYAGGIVGFSSWYHGEVRNCVAMSDSIIAGMDAGGIFGGFNSNVTADCVSVAAKVDGSYASGIVGAYGFGYQNCYWLKVTDDQPQYGNASMGIYDYGKITDESQLPVASAVFDSKDFGTIKPGERREIHIFSYPPQADASHLQYTWSVDTNKLVIVDGQGTNTLTVEALNTAEDIAFAAVSADVYGLLGHTTEGSGDDAVHTSNFETTVSISGMLKIASAPIAVEKVAAFGETENWGEGEARTLGAAITPSDADNTEVTWELSGISGAASSDDVIMETMDDGSLRVTLRSGHESAASYTFTVTTADGGFTDSITLNSAVVKDVNISGIIPVGKVVTTYTDAVKPVGATSSMLYDIIAAAGTSAESFRTNSAGIVFLASEKVNAAVDKACELNLVEAERIRPLPVFMMNATQTGRLTVSGIILDGSALMAGTPEEVSLVMTRPDGTGEFFAYAEDQDAIGNKRFTLQRMDDTLMGPKETISPDEQYKLIMYIQDGTNFDFDAADGSIISAAALVTLKEEPAAEQPVHSGGSGGGCSAGFGALALLAALPLVRISRGKRSK